MDEQNQAPANDQQNDQAGQENQDQQSGGNGAPEIQEMQIGKYKVKIIKSKCIGAASCVAVSPSVYELNDENVAIFKDGGTDSEENTVAAAQSCPTKAIEIIDTESGEQVWPQE